MQRNILKAGLALAMLMSMVTYGATIAHWDMADSGAVNGGYMTGNGERADLGGPAGMDTTDFRISSTDLSGNGNHLTAWTSSWMKWTSDSFTGDFSMKSANDWPAAGTDSEYNPDLTGIDVETITPAAWTVEALFKVTGLWVSSTETIVGRDGYNINGIGGDRAALYLSVRGGGGMYIGFTDVTGIYHETGTTYAGLAVGQWYHVAGVSDGTTLSLYINGLLVTSLDMTGSSTDTRLAADTDANGDTYGWSVSRGMFGSNDYRHLDHTDRLINGMVDEVAISDDALAPGSFVISGPALPSGNSTNLVLNGEFDDGGTSWSNDASAISYYTDHGDNGPDTIVSWSGSGQTGIWQDTGAVFQADTEYQMTVKARKGGPGTTGATLSIIDVDNSWNHLVDTTVAFQLSTSGDGTEWEVLTATFNTADDASVIGHRIGVRVDTDDWIHVDSVTLVPGTRQLEKLDRGVVAVSTGSGIYVGWRLFGTDPADIGFNVYRDGIKVNATPITDSTNYLDATGVMSNSYSIVPVIGSIEQAATQPVFVWDSYCRSIDLAPIDGDYYPNDASVGDLDGDGDYEIVIKRLSSDVSQTSTTFHMIEAYHLDGTFMWRINLGANNLYASHEINPMVYDFDGDGRAEVAVRTCEGNIDGIGFEIGDTDGDGKTDYRDTVASDYMTEGPEFLSIFDGRTGEEIDRADYIERDPIDQWGVAGLNLGQNAHRADKCMMTPAYLDGQRPSLVICRGIYARTVLEAWNFRDGSLSRIWTFNSADWPGYAGQGNHNLTVGDVDNDGKDEIVYAQMCVDDDGTGLYTTQLGHGDAMHMSDMDPGRPGLEYFSCHEHSPYGTTLRDARTGEILMQLTASGDTGRCCAAHIDSRYPGYQMWSVASGGTYNATYPYDKISDNLPNWGNFLIWWTDDLQRELLDSAGSGGSPIIDKWWGDSAGRYLSLYNVPTDWSTATINGTKANPCLSGDIIGDWREECIYRSSDNTKLRIFTTTHVSTNRIYTLMHDSQYRQAIAWQCNMYNQPPHPSFYIGEGMSDPPTPAIDPIGTGDTTPPAEPTDLTASADGDQIILDWADNTETDLASYTVYRGTTAGGPYAGIATKVTSSTYTDNSAVNGTTYYYVVVAVDTSANVSAYSNQASAVGGPDLVAYYEMEDNVNDSSGNGNNAVATGTPTYTTGNFGQAIDLDGTDDYVTLPSGILNTDDITIAAWIYWDGGDIWQRIFDFGNDTDYNMFLTPSSGGGTLRFGIKSGGSEQIVETSVLATGTWIHVAVTLNGDIATLYVDGEEASSNSSTTINPSDFNPVNNYIGKSQWPDPLFNGRIDDFRIYNFALTEAQVAATMAGNTAPSFTTDPISNLDGIELSDYAGTSLATYVNDDGIGGSVTFSKDSGPAWLVMASDGTLSGIPGNANVGSNTFTVRVTDPGALYDTAQMTIQVTNVYSGTQGMDDLLGLVSQWLSIDCPDTPACNGASLDGDDDVTMTDFSVLGYNWLADESLQLHLQLDETSGLIAYDNSIYTRHGDLINGPVWTSGQVGGALDFDGSDDYVQITSYKGITDMTSRTCAFWIKTTSSSVDILGWGRLFDDNAQYVSGQKYQIVFYNEEVGVLVQGGNAFCAAPEVNDDQWHHVAVVFDDANDDGILNVNETQFYIDGSASALSRTAPLEVNTAAYNDVHLGMYPEGDTYWLDGSLDDLRIYDRALTEQEIQGMLQ